MDSEVGSRRRGRPSGLTGAQLLAVAREQFLSHGFRGTTMDAVAARAGVSKQSLYAAHPSKDGLFAAVVRDWVDQGYDAMRPSAETLSGCTDIRAGLRDLAAVLHAGILSPAVLQMRALIIAEAEALPEVAADYAARSWDRNISRLAEALTELARRGILAVDVPQVAAQQFVWLVIGAPLNRLSLVGSGHGYTDAELEQIADEAVTTFLDRYLARV